MIKPDIKFGVDHIVLPPQRDYKEVNYVDGEHFFRLERFTMEDLRQEYSNRAAYEMPPVQGNWDLAQTWVNNMWEAMYNPIWVLKYDHPNKRKWNYGVFDGHHRLRLFDALGADGMWMYVQNIKVINKPKWVKDAQVYNNRAPRHGVFGGPCVHCDKKRVKYRITRTPNHKLMGGKLLCGKCGGKIPHPWPGVL